MLFPGNRKPATGNSKYEFLSSIRNILSNAIKFTPAGRQVALTMERADHQLKIRVTDQGEGIEASFLPYVFERLRQADGSATRSGLGLGLAIPRHIVELHHGEIVAESEGRGKGSRFTVTLPLAQTRVEKREPETVSA